MTDQQKAAFLKSEGWKKNLLGTGIYWADPVTPSSGEEWVQMCPFDEAYRIASRRKRERETRRLKAAGWHWDGTGWHKWAGIRTASVTLVSRTRAEALATLEKP